MIYKSLLSLLLLGIALACLCDGLRIRPPTKRPPVCGPVCAIYCPYGNVLDHRGCPTCTCKPNPNPCPPVCKIYCPCGNVRDYRGCPICKCKPCHG